MNGYASGWRDDTLTSFPAITDDTEIIPAAGECRCGMCPRPGEPGTGALLSCAPGVVSRMWRTRVANGQWANIPAAFDDAHADTFRPTLKTQRRIRDQLATGRHDIAAVLDRNRVLLTDQALRAGLRDLESRLAGRLADMQAESAVRQAAA